VAVTANGEFLKPMIVFKGKPGGRIEREFSDYPDGSTYAVQEKAWMSEPLCLRWVEEVVKPWAESAPDGIVPYLLLDSYKCHLMKSVVDAIQDLGIEVEHVPGGCTGLAQPVDVGINKPLKNRIRCLWENFMIDGGLAQAVSKPPDRATMAEWCIQSLNSIGQDIGKNAWKHRDYSYFPNEVPNVVTAPINENVEGYEMVEDV
jgi:hypothetical protein